MNKKILSLLLALLTAVMLAACNQEPTEDPGTYPTLPSIQQNKTPLELLHEATEKTKNAAAFTVRYGKATTSGGESTGDTFTQNVSADHSFDMATLYADVPDFPTNEALLSDFCALPLRAIPSNDGTIRYALSELTVEELNALMYGQSTAVPEYSEYAQVVCTAAMVVNADGYFSELEFTVELYSSADQLERIVTFFLSLSEIEA